MADTIRDFAGDVRTEMQKVTWPTWPELKSSTGVILAFVVALAVIIFVMDFVSAGLLQFLTSILGG